MYRNTTPWQVGRAVGVWLLGFGVVLLPFLVTQLQRITWPAGTTFAALLLAVGGLVYFGSTLALRSADAANRPLLLSPQGHTVLTGREAFELKVVALGRVVLALFLVAGAGFVFAIGQHSCGDRDAGVCGLPRLSYDGTVWIQLVCLGLGAAYLAFAVLRTIHARETERIGNLVSEGRRIRRSEDPFAGTRREGWDFD
jgi:hypothetical protein